MCDEERLSMSEAEKLERRIARIERLRRKVGRLKVGTRISYQGPYDLERKTGVIALVDSDFGYRMDNDDYVLWKSHNVSLNCLSAEENLSAGRRNNKQGRTQQEEKKTVSKQSTPPKSVSKKARPASGPDELARPAGGKQKRTRGGGHPLSPERLEARLDFARAVNVVRLDQGLAAPEAVAQVAGAWTRPQPPARLLTAVNYHSWCKSLPIEELPSRADFARAKAANKQANKQGRKSEQDDERLPEADRPVAAAGNPVADAGAGAAAHSGSAAADAAPADPAPGLSPQPSSAKALRKTSALIRAYLDEHPDANVGEAYAAVFVDPDSGLERLGGIPSYSEMTTYFAKSAPPCEAAAPVSGLPPRPCSASPDVAGMIRRDLAEHPGALQMLLSNMREISQVIAESLVARAGRLAGDIQEHVGNFCQEIETAAGILAGNAE
jgi:hypothetical protein